MSNNTQPEIRFPGFTEDWEQRKVGEFYDFKNGLNKEKEFFGSGVPIVNFVDVFHNRGLTPEMLKGRVTLSEKEIKNFEVKQGDIFFTRTSETINEIGYPSVMLGAPTDTVFSGFVLRGRARSVDPMNNLFKRYVFFTESFRNEMVKKSSMTTRALTSGTAIKEMYVQYPTSKDEQHKIGAFLAQIDETITLKQRKLDLLKETKKGFLQKMFPKNGAKVPEIRFPGFTEDWEERKLGDMMDVTSVKRIHQSDWTNSGIRFLRARDIVSAAKNEEPSDYLYISEEKYNEYSKISGKVSQGDLLVTGVGSIGVPLLITDDNPIYFKDGNIIWFKNEHKIDGNFFYYSFINNKIQKYIRDVAGIGTVGTYTIDSGKKTPISLPTYDEQIKIGSFFKQLDHTIMLHQHELDLLKETKKGFLQKMFA